MFSEPYSLEDIFRLQKITYNQIYLAAIFSLLWDKGYTDVPSLQLYLNEALETFRLKESPIEAVHE